jgi:DnaJ-class molecular chaperone
MNKYVTELIECPECGGEGKTETMTWLTYSGSQSWSVERCEKCHGSGETSVNSVCVYCGEEILVEEKAEIMCHKDCVETPRNPTVQ